MTTQQSIDMSAVIDALAQSRPAFYSESDFNHALSWQIQKVHPSMGVRQEVANLIEGPGQDATSTSGSPIAGPPSNSNT